MSCQIRHPQNISEIDSILNMVQRCFPKLDRVYFMKRILADPYYTKKNTYTLFKDNNLVSHVQLFRKKIYCYGKQLPVIGLGLICTLPEYRDKGYCIRLLKKIFQDIYRKDIPLLILLTKIPSFYKKLGFLEVEKEYYLLKELKIEKMTFPNKEKIKIRAFNFGKDILSVMDIYNNYFSYSFGAAVREFKDWFLQLSYFNEEKRLFLVIEDQSGIRAYVRCKRYNHDNQKFVDIIECASRRNDRNFLFYLLKYICEIRDIGYVRIDKKIIINDFLKSFEVTTKKDSIVMYKFMKKPALINRKRMNEMVFLESDGF